MFAAAQAPALTMDPDPPGAGTDTPSRIGRVLGVLRKLIDYGRHLAAHGPAARRRPGTSPCSPDPSAPPTSPSSSPASPPACAAPRPWKQALPARRTRPGPDTNAHPPARPTPATPVTARSRRRTHQPDPARRAPRIPRLARLPTEEEIAAEVRRRPVGAVIVDICRDLGISARPAATGPFWDELSHAIIAYGGSLAGFHRQAEQAAVRLRPQRPCGPHVAHGTAKTSGARHRPALTKKISSCGVRSAEDGTADKSRAAQTETVVQLLAPRHWSLPIVAQARPPPCPSAQYMASLSTGRGSGRSSSATISIVTGCVGIELHALRLEVLHPRVVAGSRGDDLAVGVALLAAQPGHRRGDELRAHVT